MAGALLTSPAVKVSTRVDHKSTIGAIARESRQEGRKKEEMGRASRKNGAKKAASADAPVPEATVAIRMRIGGLDMEIEPSKLYGVFQRLVKENNLQDKVPCSASLCAFKPRDLHLHNAQAEEIAMKMVEQTDSGGQMTLSPADVATELGLEVDIHAIRSDDQSAQLLQFPLTPSCFPAVSCMHTVTLVPSLLAHS